MSLVLRVDGERWRAHLTGVRARRPLVVPVAKGNGYGLGLARLARKAQWLGVDTLAVGIYEELPHVSQRYDGSLLVMTPWRSFNGLPEDQLSARVIHTVGRLEELEALAAHGRTSGHRPRVVLERLTSMRRHGFSAPDLRAASRVVREQGGVVLEGVALHLPLVRASHLPEVERLLQDVVAADLGRGLDKLDQRSGPTTIWVSHLGDEDLASLARRWPELIFRPRMGTDLWLGDRGALAVRSTVLDAHPVERGDTYGYRGRSAPRAGTILIVSGGTSHGIGLEAPTGEQSLKSRAASIARGGLDAAGFVRSPFTVGGKQRLFAEPPHMQASMLFLPAGSDVPAVGEEIEVRVRFTATDVDRVVLS